MELTDVKKIMQKYKLAWEKQNTQLILDCFTKNGVYQESPLAKPYKGHKEIARFWKEVVVQNTKNIKFNLKKCYLSSDKKVGFAEWTCKNENRQDKNHAWKKEFMTGIMILKIKDSKIIYLNEYWKTKSI